ncbi:hypothetical protein L218DRAFT_734968 [Marasmius fiardii PR-910]|nr:hypothetical protein L218DRAFT_734968 [Marasmius fiardii PR-910]
MASKAIAKVVEGDGEEIGRWDGVASDGSGIITVIQVFAGLFLSAFALYRYLRSFIYPCLTPVELDQALKTLDEIYRTSRAVLAGPGEADAPEWSAIAHERLQLKIEASHIREKSLQSSGWKRYLGCHPRLMLDIADCHTKYEELKCRIFTACEKNLQSRLEAEQYQRRIATRLPSEAQAYVTAYESLFRSEAEDDFPRSYSIS